LCVEIELVFEDRRIIFRKISSCKFVQFISLRLAGILS
jgi:hypothetical protein